MAGTRGGFSKWVWVNILPSTRIGTDFCLVHVSIYRITCLGPHGTWSPKLAGFLGPCQLIRSPGEGAECRAKALLKGMVWLGCFAAFHQDKVQLVATALLTMNPMSNSCHRSWPLGDLVRSGWMGEVPWQHGWFKRVFGWRFRFCTVAFPGMSCGHFHKRSTLRYRPILFV